MKPLRLALPLLVLLLCASPARAADEVVALLPATDLDALAKTYPAVKNIVDDVKESNSESAGDKDAQTEISYAQLDETDPKVGLLFVYQESETACGTAGCDLSVYVNEGIGYAPALDVTVREPIAVSKKNGKLFLVFQTEQGRQEWEFADHAFKHVGKSG